MHEKSGERLQQLPEHLQWYATNEFVRCNGDTLQFLDPVYGEPLESGALPRCIIEDPICGPGLDHLQSLAEQDTPIVLIFNYHRGMEDFDPLIEKTGHILNEVDFIGLEWNWSEPSMPLHLDDIMWKNPSGEGFPEYIKATKERFDGKAFPCDIDTPLHEDDTLRHRLHELLRYAGEEQDCVTPQDYERCHLGWITYHYIRGFAMPATFGYMAKVAQEKRRKASNAIALVIGSGHSVAVPEKLAYLGVPTTSLIVHPLEDEPASQLHTAGMRNAQLSLSNLQEVAGIEQTA